MNLGKAMSTPIGAIIISVILGLGLAALFRTVCHGDGCVVIKAPDASELQKFVYRIGGNSANDAECYKYTPEEVPCPLKKKN
jgi:hypothetical protein